MINMDKSKEATLIVKEELMNWMRTLCDVVVADVFFVCCWLYDVYCVTNNSTTKFLTQKKSKYQWNSCELLRYLNKHAGKYLLIKKIISTPVTNISKVLKKKYIFMPYKPKNNSVFITQFSWTRHQINLG